MMKAHLYTIFAGAALLMGPVGLAQVKEDVHIVLAGDSNWHRKLSVYDDPAYLQLIDKFHKADASFTNLETLIHPLTQSANPWAGGGYAYSPPWLVNEIKWVGFNLISVANNHAFDYGADGLRSSMHALDDAHIAYAGGGENLAFARAPVYLDTKHGRIALIASASTLREGSLAGAQRIDLHGRIGVNPLRFNTTYTLDPQLFDSLHKLSSLERPARGGGEEGGSGASASGSSTSFTFAGARYQQGDHFSVTTKPFQTDLDETVESIKEARRQADFVIVSIHSHEGLLSNSDLPAEFLVTYAHAAIDVGADIFVAHGPQQIKGIEIYKGKPIFYSLGNFVFDGEAGIPFLPAESYESEHLPWNASTADFRDSSSKSDTYGYPASKGVWNNAVAEITLGPDHKLKEIVLDPITLGYGKSRTQRGHPMPASPEDAKDIIAKFNELSSTFGTKINFVSGHGVIVLNNK
jgi:poly-gamma-glutamate capsule biosynthesis protein CapA/YwtB (metallophosphatase superfamily)